MTGCFLDSNAASKAVRSFWLLGLLNNSPWVLMLACATNISAGGVALVFISNIIPGLMVKISAPYWFHLISYKTRISMASVTMGLSCFLVGCGGTFRDELKEDSDGDRDSRNGGDKSLGLALELVGVSFMSFASSLGEASLLALAGKFDSMILPTIAAPDSYRAISEGPTETVNVSRQNFEQEYRLDDNIDETESEVNTGKLMKQGVTHQRTCITAFSSGTGLAGIVGFAYKALFSEFFGWGLSATVWSAMAFPPAYSLIYLKGLHDMDNSAQRLVQPEAGPSSSLESFLFVDECDIHDNSLTRRRHGYGGEESGSALEMSNTDITHPDTMQQLQTDLSVPSRNITAYERFQLVLSLWRYTIPLFTVYAAEYMLQAGVWSAIGFPVTSATARAQFYHYSNWTYQAGVFISRSSGNMWTASITTLWLMPFLQIVNLYFFWLDSLHHFWYNYSLMLPCFFAGLLGGSVYVQGFSRVNMDMPMDLREFAIASVGVADSLGILVADVLSLFLQSCIYNKHGIEGAVVDCPVNM
ncbi:hypothetical protein ACHAW5_006927 [Stephanodiscus triporus]|uniref:Battenin n=1 Tax=Stephanodiscus triporus TaxID=2934178 RepID=A0ABD3MQW9_9STRA